MAERQPEQSVRDLRVLEGETALQEAVTYRDGSGYGGYTATAPTTEASPLGRMATANHAEMLAIVMRLSRPP